jgi:hypothetical protein
MNQEEEQEWINRKMNESRTRRRMNQEGAEEE